MKGAYRRAAALSALAAVTALGLAACGGSGSPHVVSLGTTTPSTANSTTSAAATGSTTTVPANGGNATELVDQWASCMRHHGDPSQADPVIDVHGVINIIVPPVSPGVNGDRPVVTGGPESPTGTCSQYLAAAQQALRAANPVSPPPTRSQIINYVDCMRAHGVTNYPYPTGEKGNFNGTGINLNSPAFLHADDVCSKRIYAPAWWTNGWGPPGDISTRSALIGSNGPGSGG